ncbi:LacI family DNA-binding transcriptional regulator [Pseudarthrobacter sp. N5]|uniref:LacI family DNA-binding transcriptional regulator n=1 Tax=Pseudarthrobacter sp. N5 TaxID=3418416 RepID=UPI003CEC6BF4
MAKRPTVYDVAERAGVSIATVSFTFRQPDRVRPATRETVLSAAASLGYVPSASARGLANGRTGALGLFAFDYLLDTADNPGADQQLQGNAGMAEGRRDDPNEDFRIFPVYVDEVQRGVELECLKRGYALMISGGNPSSGDAVLTDIAGRVDGLAVFPGSDREEAVARVSRRIPVVQISDSYRSQEFDCVTVDNAGGMRELVRHLIDVHELADLQFVGLEHSPDIQARRSGFLAALTEVGLTSPQRPQEWSQENYSGFDSASAYVDALLGRDALPQALVCATDEEALAIMDALAAAGVRVPEQVAVTGFDGIVAGRISRPALTTVRQPMEQMGRAVVGMLIDRLENPDMKPVRRELPVTVVLRESCGCTQR